MSELTLLPVLRADGCLALGEAIIEPWPSLRITGQFYSRQLHGLILITKPDDPWWPFVDAIPLPLREMARIVPDCAWHLVELVAADSQCGSTLLVEAPALAVLIVCSLVAWPGDRTERMRRLLPLRWHDILGEHSLPRERRLLRLFRKLPIYHCQPNTVMTLADAIRRGHPHIRLLSHLPRVTQDTVSLLHFPAELVNAHLLLASSQSEPGQEPVSRCVETVTWFREVEGPGRHWPYGHLTAQDLARVEEAFRARHTEGGNLPFPEPPLPDVPGRITALRDSRAVESEGDQQLNCAAGFIPDIIRYTKYLYSITVMERATLALRREKSGRWALEDLRAKNNRPPSWETTNFVEAWLAAHQPETKPSTEEDCPL
jgi:hypothetical protein